MSNPNSPFSPKSMEYLGKTVKKEFAGFGIFQGVVDSFDSSTGFFKIVYEDGDSEEADFSEVVSLVEMTSSSRPPELGNRVGRKPKRRRRSCRVSGMSTETLGFSSGNEICDSDSGMDLDLDLNRGFGENRECIDLNLTVVSDEFDEVLENGKKERGFDLNLGLSDENSNGGTKVRNNDFPVSFVDESHVNSTRNEIKLEVTSPDVIAEDVSSGHRKRQNIARNLTSPTETVLRRSARRAKAVALNECDSDAMLLADGVNELCVSGVTDGSEERVNVLGLERLEEPWVLPPKMELPPCSVNLDLEGVPVLDIFSVYSCLRSFSTLLYLSPFGLEDLVAALKSRISNFLIDCTHVSILQTLRKHLQFLANEGCESASTCLRNMDWNLLDVITWPVFMVEYLLIHGSRLKLGFSLDRLNLFDGEYYSQPESVKLELLRCLCDDVIEVEAIRSELSKRMIMDDATMEIDRPMSSDISRKRRMSFGDRGDSSVNEDMLVEVGDGNSDECCLCKMDGNLICCDGCPAAYHSKCVGIVGSLLPDGDWHCPECMVGRANLGTKPRTLIRGAELLGTDPYGRLYFSCFNYLLVSDSYDAESSFNYYHKDDIGAVIQFLQLSGVLYESILSAVAQQWAIRPDMSETVCDVDSKKWNTGTLGGWKVSSTIKCTMEIESPHTNSEGSAEDFQSKQLNPNSLRPRLFEIDGQAMEAESISTAKPQKRSRGRPRLVPKAKEENVVPEIFGDVYTNSYTFARTAFSIVEELLRKPLDKVNVGRPKTEEEIISIQLKFILRKSAKFCWPTIQGLDVDRQKENCGWCYCCRFAVEGRECLFTFVNRTPVVAESLNAEADSVLSKKKGHIVDVIFGMLSMEQRLRGLLLGPWLRPHYSELWRKDVFKASDVSSLKRSLLLLESNLHPSALSADWWKHVDSVKTMGSASHFVAKSRGISRKKGKIGESEIKSLIAAGGLGLFWWRGGKISRSLFNWKVVPRTLALKTARKAGRIKIVGIQYPDGSENARRSKCLAWRASVETSTILEQLALLVRELDMFLRWDDIENTHSHFLLDKESIKSIRLFKKAIIRRKCVEGTQVKYLIDFGKRRCMPDVIIKHGVKFEDDSNEKKKYWLDEPYVPLHLLKNFEERRIIRKESTKNSSRPRKVGRVMKKSSREKGFDYLFSRAEKADNYQCGHCNKHVLVSEAVSCRHCNGFFHKGHVKKLSEAITSESIYTCHRCQAGKHVKNDSAPRKSKRGNLQDAKNLKVGRRGRPPKLTSTSRRGRPPKLTSTARNGKPFANCGTMLSGKNKKAKAQNHKRPSPHDVADAYSGMTLRRSARTAAHIPIQPKSAAGGKKGKRKRNRSRKVAVKESPKSSSCQKEIPKKSSCQKRRTRVFHSFWMNGLLLSKKPNDERVVQFKRRKLLQPYGFSAGNDDPPKCSLCCEKGPALASLSEGPVSALMYIACEICGDWFHGDAFGLNEENIGSVIGFKCHVCREKNPPICPFCGLLKDATELGAQNTRESQEPQIQKKTDNVMEICPEIVSCDRLEIQTIEKVDGELLTVDNSFAKVDHDKCPVMEPELQVGNGSSDNNPVIAYAIENPNLVLGSYLSTDCAQELNSDEVSAGQFDVQRIQDTDRYFTQDTTAAIHESQIKEGNGSTDSKVVMAFTIDTQCGDKADLSTGHVCFGNVTLDTLKVQPIQTYQRKTPLLHPELRVEKKPPVHEEVISNAIDTQCGDTADLSIDLMEEYPCHGVAVGRLKDQSVQIAIENLLTPGFEPGLIVENGSPDKEVIANATENQNRNLNADFSTDRGQDLQGDRKCLGFLKIHTAQNSAGNLDEMRTPILDSEQNLENGSPASKEVMTSSQTADLKTAYVQEFHCDDVSPSHLYVPIQNSVENLHQAMRAENESPDIKEVASIAFEGKKAGLEANE